VRIGSSEAVLEAVRGGHSLLWTNGRQARRFVLGLGSGGHLSLQLRAPKLPVRVVPRELITVVPGGRVAGYLQVSLVPTLVWHGTGSSDVLLELLPEDQTAEWDEDTGHSLQAGSPWFARFPMRNGEPRAVVPVRASNRTAEVQIPPFFEVRLRDEELVLLRGSIVVPPRRLQWRGELPETVVRMSQRTGVGA
jgi:hypothetical protein